MKVIILSYKKSILLLTKIVLEAGYLEMIVPLVFDSVLIDNILYHVQKKCQNIAWKTMVYLFKKSFSMFSISKVLLFYERTLFFINIYVQTFIKHVIKACYSIGYSRCGYSHECLHDF